MNIKPEQIPESGPRKPVLLGEPVGRVVDGIKVAFVDSETYFASLFTPSMVSTARETGAEVVLLLAPGVSPDAMTDEEIRALLALMTSNKEPPHA